MYTIEKMSERNRKTIFGANREKRYEFRNANGIIVEPLANLPLSVRTVLKNFASIAKEMLGFTTKQILKNNFYSGVQLAASRKIKERGH